MRPLVRRIRVPAAIAALTLGLSAAPRALPAATGADGVRQDTTPAVVRGYTGMAVGGLRTSRLAGTTVADTSTADLVVMRVEPGSPAEQAGIAPGDVLLEVNGDNIREKGIRLGALAPGIRYSLRIRRDDDEVEVTLVPEPARTSPARPVP